MCEPRDDGRRSAGNVIPALAALLIDLAQKEATSPPRRPLKLAHADADSDDSPQPDITFVIDDAPDPGNGNGRVEAADPGQAR
jgi:hypothetical protein